MEEKNRLLLVAAITVVITAAMFTSFGRSLLATNLPAVVLPEPEQTQSSQSAPGSEISNSLLRVEVTSDTVQNVIASLERSSSYYREVTVETFWDSGSSAVQVQIWVDGGWTHVRQTLPSGLIRHDLIGEEQVFYWYDGESVWCTAPALDSSADLAQRIPTYETVLSLPVESISAAGYELKGGVPCIYVEVYGSVAGYQERYWISVDSGLLVAAETMTEETDVVYRMSALNPIQSLPVSEQGLFCLPDGTVMHAVSH